MEVCRKFTRQYLLLSSGRRYQNAQHSWLTCNHDGDSVLCIRMTMNGAPWNLSAVDTRYGHLEPTRAHSVLSGVYRGWYTCYRKLGPHLISCRARLRFVGAHDSELRISAMSVQFGAKFMTCKQVWRKEVGVFVPSLWKRNYFRDVTKLLIPF